MVTGEKRKSEIKLAAGIRVDYCEDFGECWLRYKCIHIYDISLLRAERPFECIVSLQNSPPSSRAIHQKDTCRGY